MALDMRVRRCSSSRDEGTHNMRTEAWLGSGAAQPMEHVDSAWAGSGQAPDGRRVLIVSQATVDGVAVCVRDLVEAAVGRGYDITVACPSAGDLAGWAQDRGAVWERLEMRRSPHPSDLLAVARLRQLARAHSLIHLHSSKAGAVGRLALASLGRARPPSVFTPHGWSWLAGGSLAPVYRLTERIMLPVTAAVVAVSDEERAHGQAVLGSRATRIVVNPNGVDVARFCPHGPVTRRAGDHLVVCIGRLCHQRAPDVAVAALAHVSTPGVRLRLVGEGQDRAAIENQARVLGLEDRVELTGFSPDPAADIRAADVVVVPSRYDGMALILLEAMACGAAIVATRAAGSSILEGAGVLVPVEDPRALAEAIDGLLADADRRRSLGLAARKRVAEQYSLQRSLEGILCLWHRLGIRPAPGPAVAPSMPSNAMEMKAD
jgi:glycosyltransferase involved in cell wall biosynthesis